MLLMMISLITHGNFVFQFVMMCFSLNRHGAAHYEVYRQNSKDLVAAGTLVVSDELADR